MAGCVNVKKNENIQIKDRPCIYTDSLYKAGIEDAGKAGPELQVRLAWGRR
ncbi:MAG: hypothetical protein LBB81_06695 [Treponema sp.]|nr:hypothetical protein [Treponema sp.]